MAFTSYTREHGIEPGMNGQFVQHGMIAFATTGTTVELPCNLSRIVSYSLTPVGTPATGEVLSINETVSDSGQITVAAGAVTVTRAAGTTSGLIVSYRIVGY
jgi:hypothetical protein